MIRLGDQKYEFAMFVAINGAGKVISIGRLPTKPLKV